MCARTASENSTGAASESLSLSRGFLAGQCSPKASGRVAGGYPGNSRVREASRHARANRRSCRRLTRSDKPARLLRSARLHRDCQRHCCWYRETFAPPNPFPRSSIATCRWWYGPNLPQGASNGTRASLTRGQQLLPLRRHRGSTRPMSPAISPRGWSGCWERDCYPVSHQALH